MTSSHRGARKNVIRQDAAIWQQNPCLFVAAIAAKLGTGRRPEVRCGIVNVRLGAADVAGQDAAVGQELGWIVTEGRLRKIGDRRPGVSNWIVDFARVRKVLCSRGATVFTSNQKH